MTGLRPCPKVSDHGLLVERTERLTREQAWCGTWWDCPDPRCGTSVLDPSVALLRQDAAYLRANGHADAEQAARADALDARADALEASGS